MTSFLAPGMGGIGSSPTPSTDTSALKAIDSRNVSYANKDFVKNIAWLNNSVDTLSQWSQKLQSGVDAANQNFIEQIQGLIADFFVLFSGGQPTGIDFGDLQYVLQGIGALFGINPDTPFPMNLFEATQHFFQTYLVPQQQFSDVIYDSIFAWAEDLGLSQELIDSFHELQDAQLALNQTWTDTFDALNQLFMVFQPDQPEWGELWDAVNDLFAGIPTLDLKPVISMLADLGIPFIKALTWLVQQANSFLTPLSNISGSQIAQLGDNIVPAATGDTTIWGVGSNDTNSWIYDSDTQAFTTLGNGLPKRIVTQEIQPCDPGKTMQATFKLKWQGIPSSTIGVGIGVVFMQGQNEVVQMNVRIPDIHTVNSDWTQIAPLDITAPQDIDGVKFAVYVDSTVTSGRVQIKDITVQPKGLVKIGYIDQLTEWLESLVPLDVWAESLGIDLPSTQDIIDWIASVLKQGDSINAGNLFGDLPRNMLDIIPLSSLSQDEPNFLTDPGFLDPEGIDGKGIWFWDGTVGYSELGSAKVIADGTRKALIQKEITATNKNQRISLKIKAKWGLLAKAGTGQGIALDIILYKGNTKFTTERVGWIDNPNTNGSDWVSITGGYTVEDPEITGYRMRIVVTELITSGIIHFDDAENRRNQLIALDWVDGARDWLESLGDTINQLLQDGLNALVGLFDPNGDTWSWIADFGDALNDLWTDAQDALSKAFDANGLATEGNSWLGRIIKDMEILLDFFHVVYPLGSPSDTKTTTIGGKRTYYSAWADLSEALGWAGSSAATGPPINVKGQIDAAGSAANAANTLAGQADTKATTGNSWLASIIEDATILLDFFHITYPLGSPSDNKNTTIGGKRTYYAAWARFSEALGWANAGAPVPDAPQVNERVYEAQTTATSAQNGVTTLDGQTTQINSDIVNINVKLEDLYTKVDELVSPPEFDSVGTGDTAAQMTLFVTKTVSLSWTHNATSAADYVLVFVTFSGGTSISSYILTAKYGGVTMSRAGLSAAPKYGVSDSYSVTVAFFLKNPPSGNQTVTFTGDASNVGGSYGRFEVAVGNSIAYRNVASVGSMAGWYTNSAQQLTQSVSATKGQLIVHNFSAEVLTALNWNFSGYTQTTRSTKSVEATQQSNSSIKRSMRIILGESVGGPSPIDFYASMNSSSTSELCFMGNAIILSPPTPT